MCLLGIAFRQFEGVPVVIFANREEDYARPAEGPMWWTEPSTSCDFAPLSSPENSDAFLYGSGSDSPIPPLAESPGWKWFGGRDLVARGTWLGVNPYGLFAAVTNRRGTGSLTPTQSRGTLCRRVLRHSEFDAAVDWAERTLREQAFAGCNLVVGTRARLRLFEWTGTLRVSDLDPGLHLITNGPLDDPRDLRIARTRLELEPLSRGGSLERFVTQAERLCASSVAENGHPPICVDRGSFGTVSSTIITLDDEPCRSTCRHAPESPARTPYVNLTDRFIEGLNPQAESSWQGCLFITPVPRATAGSSLGIDARPPSDSLLPPGRRLQHAMFLRGPWTATWLDSTSNAGSGPPPIGDAASQRPNGSPARESRPIHEHEEPPRSVRLPATWHSLWGDRVGKSRYLRLFHGIPNLDATDEVWLVLRGTDVSGAVRLNGETVAAWQPVDLRDATGSPTAIDIWVSLGGRLLARNQLEIELDPRESDDAKSLSSLSQPVQLAILRKA